MNDEIAEGVGCFFMSAGLCLIVLTLWVVGCLPQCSGRYVPSPLTTERQSP